MLAFDFAERLDAATVRLPAPWLCGPGPAQPSRPACWPDRALLGAPARAEARRRRVCTPQARKLTALLALPETSPERLKTESKFLRYFHCPRALFSYFMEGCMEDHIRD